MAAEAAAGAAESGMPQLDISTFPNQIFWLAVTMVVIYFVLSRIALPRIASVLAERSGTISNDIAAAEELKQQAVAAEAAYEKALRDARAEANRIIAATKAEIQEELASELKRADARIAEKAAESEAAIAAIRATAVENVTAVAKDTAAEIVAAFGAKADAATIDQAIDARMKE
ncbi:MAG: F0F1 ATP synthase subunit B' [Limimaricola sp.]|uniref:F0F1 ATP synthase subunit B' n=1 Tax=Limimaricola sp. TaxID=2211665 RepID=UPI001DED8784|nr:F0F1 ATP synthase subunit B' [Limimaricola sp.]MBI1417599.1 F0F1 ATP synthase subunit B' [Limimaricola sp.]